MLTAAPCPSSADIPSISVTPRHTYNAPLVMVLRALAHMRAGGALLHAAEWRMYAAALAAGSVAARMAVAATVAGNAEEVSSACTDMQFAGAFSKHPSKWQMLQQQLTPLRRYRLSCTDP